MHRIMWLNVIGGDHCPVDNIDSMFSSRRSNAAPALAG